MCIISWVPTDISETKTPLAMFRTYQSPRVPNDIPFESWLVLIMILNHCRIKIPEIYNWGRISSPIYTANHQGPLVNCSFGITAAPTWRAVKAKGPKKTTAGPLNLSVYKMGIGDTLRHQRGFADPKHRHKVLWNKKTHDQLEAGLWSNMDNTL